MLSAGSDEDAAQPASKKQKMAGPLGLTWYRKQHPAMEEFKGEESSFLIKNDMRASQATHRGRRSSKSGVPDKMVIYCPFTR